MQTALTLVNMFPRRVYQTKRFLDTLPKASAASAVVSPVVSERSANDLYLSWVRKENGIEYATVFMIVELASKLFVRTQMADPLPTCQKPAY
jgi:hypothetical protein